MRESQDLTCRELVELVSDYIEGTLDPSARRRFEDHVLICDGCGAYLDQMRRTLEIVGSLSEDSLPADSQTRLLAAFRDWHRHPGAGSAGPSQHRRPNDNAGNDLKDNRSKS